MAKQVSRELYERIVKNFMDVIILSRFRNNNSFSGYDLILFINKKFDFLISSGTVYALLYSLERNGLIEGKWNQRKRVYTLTHKGEENIKLLLKFKEQIPRVFMEIFR